MDRERVARDCNPLPTACSVGRDPHCTWPPFFVAQAPGYLRLLKGGGTEVCQLNLCLQRLASGVVPPGKSGKQDNIITEPSELLTATVTLLLPENI